jgi:hypothetical protein
MRSEQAAYSILLKRALPGQILIDAEAIALTRFFKAD